MSHILVSDHGAVRTLTINRPERRNALSARTAEELTDAVAGAAENGSGAIVLAGQGGHFSAGGDAEAILEAIGSGDDGAPYRMMRTFHRLVETIWNSPLPVVAAVAGVAYGGAFNLALACDLIYASADARFCQVFVRRGVIPDLGGAYLLPRLVGMQRAKELMLLAGEIDAPRAEAMGIVNAVLANPAAALAAATDAAAKLAGTPRYTVEMAKRLINGSANSTLAESLSAEASAQSLVLGTPAAREGFDAFLERGRKRG